VAAPVVRIALPLDQASLFELVEEPDESAPVVAERIGDRGLRFGHALVEQHEDRVVIGAEARLLVLVHRALLRGEAQPLQQEKGGRDQLRR
jgi:hypothetical protein